MRSSYIHKNLVRQISLYGGQRYHPAIRQKIQPQTRLDPNILQQKISILKHTAAQNGLISLSANQIKFKHRIFVILKKNYIKYSKWTGYEELFQNKKPSECYDAIINPDLICYSNFKIKADQECPSIQGLKFKVWVPLSNRMKFWRYIQQNQRNKSTPPFLNCEQIFTGFYGRVFDHEYRHLQGILVNTQEISNNEMYLTDDSKHNPQNYDFIKQHRVQSQFFSNDNLKTNLQRSVQKMKQQQQKSAKNRILGLDPENIPDKIDSNLKQKLNKSYKTAIQSLSKQKQMQPQMLDKIKALMPLLNTQNDKKQPQNQNNNKHKSKPKSNQKRKNK